MASRHFTQDNQVLWKYPSSSSWASGSRYNQGSGETLVYRLRTKTVYI